MWSPGAGRTTEESRGYFGSPNASKIRVGDGTYRLGSTQLIEGLPDLVVSVRSHERKRLHLGREMTRQTLPPKVSELFQQRHNIPRPSKYSLQTELLSHH